MACPCVFLGAIKTVTSNIYRLLPSCSVQIHELEATVGDFNGDQSLLNDRL